MHRTYARLTALVIACGALAPATLAAAPKETPMAGAVRDEPFTASKVVILPSPTKEAAVYVFSGGTPSCDDTRNLKADKFQRVMFSIKWDPAAAGKSVIAVVLGNFAFWNPDGPVAYSERPRIVLTLPKDKVRIALEITAKDKSGTSHIDGVSHDVEVCK